MTPEITYTHIHIHIHIHLHKCFQKIDFALRGLTVIRRDLNILLGLFPPAEISSAERIYKEVPDICILYTYIYIYMYIYIYRHSHACLWLWICLDMYMHGLFPVVSRSEYWEWGPRFQARKLPELHRFSEIMLNLVLQRPLWVYVFIYFYQMPMLFDMWRRWCLVYSKDE
jgi:hypothetical protein